MKKCVPSTGNFKRKNKKKYQKKICNVPLKRERERERRNSQRYTPPPTKRFRWKRNHFVGGRNTRITCLSICTGNSRGHSRTSSNSGALQETRTIEIHVILATNRSNMLTLTRARAGGLASCDCWYFKIVQSKT